MSNCVIMNNIDKVIRLVNSGQKPIIRFLKTSESGGLEKGQYARVEDWTVDDHEQFGLNYVIYHITLNFSEFWQYNQQIEQPIYYNHLTAEWDAKWHETKGYPVDYRETYYVDESSSDEFEIVADADLYFGIHRAFINSVRRFDGTPNAVDDYQKWLEDNLISVLIEYDNIDVLRDGELPW